MIKLIQSKRLKIPIVFLIENDEDLKELPLGMPFIRASIRDYDKCVQMLEWEVLWQSAIASGLKFNWEKILKDNGFKTWKYGIAFSDEGDLYAEGDLSQGDIENEFEGTSIDCSEFINDISYKVDIDVLKDLKLLPVWYNDIESAVRENIENTMIFNPTLYTKKLGMPLGNFEHNPIQKSVIIIDISNSIPRSISSTCLTISKTLSEQFYADILITGLKSTLYEYGTLDNITTEEMFEENGGGNEQVYFRKLLEQPRKYSTAIVFGDNHQPGSRWGNGSIDISEKQGKEEICKWEVNKIISFHTTSEKAIAGYGRWFDVKKENITHIKDWVKDLNNN